MNRDNTYDLSHLYCAVATFSRHTHKPSTHSMFTCFVLTQNTNYFPGKVLTLSEHIPPIDLKTACMKLRLSQMSYKLGSLGHRSKMFQSWASISDEPFDLLYKMLDPNPHTRITAAEALKHPFFRLCGSSEKCV